MQSAFLWIILAGFYFTAINTKTLIRKVSFEDCNNDSWRVTNVSLTPQASDVNVVAEITHGDEPTNVMHKVRLTLRGCNDSSKCTNHTDVVVADLKCGTNLTELDKEACDVAEILADTLLESGELKGNVSKSSPEGGCVHYVVNLSDSINSTKSSNGTEKSFDPELDDVEQRGLFKTNSTHPA